MVNYSFGFPAIAGKGNGDVIVLIWRMDLVNGFGKVTPSDPVGMHWASSLWIEFLNVQGKSMKHGPIHLLVWTGLSLWGGSPRQVRRNDETWGFRFGCLGWVRIGALFSTCLLGVKCFDRLDSMFTYMICATDHCT
jgi:hypothetical protein